MPDSRTRQAGQVAGALLVQATCVSIDGMALLLRGPSGTGKSDLALRLIDGGATLIADDLVAVRVEGDRAVARLPDDAPAECRGRLEVRGIGILPVPSVAEAAIRLVVDLAPGGAPERLPPPETVSIGGVDLPAIRLDPFQPSAPARLRLVLRSLAGGIILRR